MKKAIQIALFTLVLPSFIAGMAFELVAAAFSVGRDFMNNLFAD